VARSNDGPSRGSDRNLSGNAREVANAEDPLVNLIAIGIEQKDTALTREYSERLLAPSVLASRAGRSASCAFASEDYQAAAKLCAKLAELDPDHYERRFNLGVALQRTDRYEQAAKAYPRRCAAWPDRKRC
jgi:tetratricopeptide (TPR) repeat protein